MTHILSTKEFKKDEVEKILVRAEEMESSLKSGKVKKILQDKVVACIFFEPSTRTRLSFETAALRLGAQVISAENASENTSTYKGETIEDTARIISGYADIIVMRHPTAGEIGKAAGASSKPVVSAGDGAAEHPTQGFLDLYTIKKEHERTENLTIAFAGDLLYSRTLRSLVPLLNLYTGNKFVFISPKELKLPKEYTEELKNSGVSFEEVDDLAKGMKGADVLYMTRVQKERFQNIEDYNKVRNLFILSKDMLSNLKKEAIIMHPLPRINEIEHDVDADPRATYFRQAENGVPVRMALLCYALGL
jgi:aspartate carbamoyltransferase catalytic subunit